MRSLILAVRASYEPKARDSLSEQIPSIEWDRFAALAARHRVEGLAWDGLSQSDASVPAPYSDRLKERANRIAAQQLQGIATSKRMLEHFAANETGLLFLKGTALAAQAYPRPMAKDSCDIDILIDPDALADAARLLAELGFDLVTPSNVSQLDQWHARRKESVWIDRHGVQLDLHTRLADNPELLRLMDPWRRPATVPAFGLQMPTLGESNQYAYLCVHGTSSAWFRLKWLVDLHALILSHDDDLADWHTLTSEAGVGRLSRVALALLVELFTLDIAKSVLDRDPLNAVERSMVAMAKGQLLAQNEPTARPLGTLSIHLMQMLQRPGPGFIFREAARQVVEMTTR